LRNQLEERFAAAAFAKEVFARAVEIFLIRNSAPLAAYQEALAISERGVKTGCERICHRSLACRCGREGERESRECAALFR